MANQNQPSSSPQMYGYNYNPNNSLCSGALQMIELRSKWTCHPLQAVKNQCQIWSISQIVNKATWTISPLP
jgi:hypothetical protein